MSYDTTAVLLDSVTFTLPVTLEDTKALYCLVRAQPWATPPTVDVYSHDGKSVHLTILVGDERFYRRYDGV